MRFATVTSCLLMACSHDLNTLIVLDDGALVDSGSSADADTPDTGTPDAPIALDASDSGTPDGGTDAPAGCVVSRPTEEFVDPDGEVCWSEGETEVYLARQGLAGVGNYRGHLTTACARWTSSQTGSTHFTVFLQAVDSGCGNICSTECGTGHAVDAWDATGYIGPYAISRALTMLEIDSRDGVLILCRLNFSAAADQIQVILASCT